MIAESKERLPALGRSRGKIVFRFNYKEIQKEVLDGKTETAWQFEQVMVSPPIGRDKLIDAVIATRFNKASELALINNKIAFLTDKDASAEHAAEYAEYQLFREQAKAWVDEASR